MKPAVLLVAATVALISGAGAIALASGYDLRRSPGVAQPDSAIPGAESLRAGPVAGRPPIDLGRLLARNLFRSARQPPGVPYDPSRTEPVQRPQPFSLVLVGLLHGAHPAALIQGFPGVEGARVLGLSEEFGGYRLVRLDVTGVTLLRGSDSVHLKIQEASR